MFIKSVACAHKMTDRMIDLRQPMMSVVRTVNKNPLRISERVPENESNAISKQPSDMLFSFQTKQHYSAREDKLPRLFVSPVNEMVFKRLEKIGEGGFSVCYLFQDNAERMMAGKIFSRGKSCSRKRLERFEREVAIMKILDHPNIVHFIDAISGVYNNLTLSDFRKDDSVPFISPPVMFLEYCSGASVSTLLRSRRENKKNSTQKYGRLTEEETLWVAECTCRGLVYIHKKRIIHRDIKMGNLLLQSSVNKEHLNEAVGKVGIVICDFGLATQLNEDINSAHGMVGTPNYMPPELIKGRGATLASDIYSLGVTLFHCLTGRPPFNGQNVSGTYRRIKEGSYRWTSTERDTISSSMRHLVDDMMLRKPENRPSATELLTRIKNR